MVDVGVRVLQASSGHEVDERFERALLAGKVMAPEGAVLRCAADVVDDTEEVLEAAVQRPRVTFHVEEQVAGRRRRKAGEPAALAACIGWLGRQKRELRRMAPGAFDLQPGLITQPLERGLADPRNRDVALGERRHRPDACCEEPAGLVAAHPGDQ